MNKKDWQELELRLSINEKKYRVESGEVMTKLTKEDLADLSPAVVSAIDNLIATVANLSEVTAQLNNRVEELTKGFEYILDGILDDDEEDDEQFDTEDYMAAGLIKDKKIN